MLNSVNLMGRLTADPQFRTTPAGVAVCNFRLAVERTYQPKGQAKLFDFINVVCWRQTAAFVSRYFRKGQLIAVQGSIQTGSYTDKSGIRRPSFDVVAEHAFFAERRGGDKLEPAIQSSAGAEAPGEGFPAGEALPVEAGTGRPMGPCPAGLASAGAGGYPVGRDTVPAESGEEAQRP